MHLTIEISDELAAVLTTEAASRGLTPDRYVSQMLKGVLADRIR